MTTKKNRRKILLVEDDESCQETVGFFLTYSGYEVHTANNGMIGVDKAMKIKPDLILMDMDMPVMDGREATQILRTRDYKGIIAAWTDSVELSGIMDIGCNYIFKDKSIEFDKFLGTIQNLMEESNFQSMAVV